MSMSRSRPIQTVGIGAVFSLLTSAQAICIIISKNTTSGYDFSTTMLNTLTEAIKFFISLVFLCYHWQNNGWNKEEYQLDRGWDLMKYLIPAVFYAFKNVLQFSAALLLDAPTYQVLKNLNIIATGLLYYQFLGHNQDRRHLECMILLVIGIILVDIKTETDNSFHFDSMLGIILCLIIAFLSGGAGVYTEILIKNKAKKSLHVQNLQLYVFGMICNVILYFFWDRSPARGFYQGLLSWKVLSVIFTTVTSGLAASVLLKYADNIVKVYSSGLSVIFTSLFSMFYLSFHATPLFWLGTTVIIISTDIYYMKFSPPATKKVVEVKPEENQQELVIVSTQK